MPGDAVGDELDAARDFFERLNLRVRDLAALARRGSALGEAVLRVDVGEMLRDHVADADTRVALLARLE